ncbi:MAG: hypothetical protein GX809_02515 [Clostridiaceae bacterium]|jgi:hypothetical protein|nr:hypothetical protein [Clostridiaceae bacterium]
MNHLIQMTHVAIQASPDVNQRLVAALIALAIALLIALIGVSNMKSKLKSVRKEQTANQYIREGSMTLQSQRDLFLHSHTEKRPRADKTKQSAN